jgi:hypothetical protein
LADLTITAANVAKGTGASTASGIAGVTITAGQSVYLDSATSTIKLADADSSATTAATVGIALHGSLAGQPITYQVSGQITVGGTMTAGKLYVVSATAGGIAPSADLTTGWRTSLLGIAISTTILDMYIINSGIAN